MSISHSEKIDSKNRSSLGTKSTPSVQDSTAIVTDRLPKRQTPEVTLPRKANTSCNKEKAFYTIFF